MAWLLVLALVLIGLVLLGLAGLRLYRAGKGLVGALGDAGDRVGAASAGLDQEPPLPRAGQRAV